ncbi:MAG: hypothetical protein FRX49_04010 [Trebouxia sp. A1-2]|nr:MAG: hypothetical protein FRX49_04010 [Trebouxia sp. A1-2]
MLDRVLIWGSGSAPCWRVMIALEEKGLQYESKQIEFSSKGHKTPEVLELNPRGQVPVLKDGDTVVSESLATLQYLEEAYPEPSLVPKGASPQNKNEPQEELDNKVKELKKELGYWESYLGSNKYIAGMQYSLADVAIGPNLMFATRLGGKFKEFPGLARYVTMLKERPSFQKSWPPHWKESQDQDWLDI